MTQSFQVTVVIPAHNAEGTLERAVRSVLAQQLEDLAIVIVDDASTDGTFAIAQRLAEESPAVTVLRQPANRGVSAARNAGLALARTEWVAFLDSDDEWLPDWSRVMPARAAGEVDVVVAGRLVCHGDGTNAPAASAALGLFSGREACRLAMLDRLTPFPWDKLFRRSLFDKVRFAEGAARFEDMMANIVLYSHARSVVSIDDPVCRYYISAGSLTWGRIPTVEDTAVALRHLEDNLDPSLRKGRYARPHEAMKVLVTMLVAQSALVRGNGTPEGAVALSGCRRQLTWARIAGAFSVRPAVGAAALLLKVAPPAYRALYLRYIRRSYGVA